MTVVGGTDYLYLGQMSCGGAISYDNTDYGQHGLGGFSADVSMFFDMFVEHKQSVRFDLQVRIHQPTSNLNNNTQAIWDATFFGGNLDGTVAPDHGDKILTRNHTFTNTGPNRWILVEFNNTVGSVDWSWSSSDCTYLPGPTGHTPYSTIPKERSRQNSGGGGGWSAGHA